MSWLTKRSLKQIWSRLVARDVDRIIEGGQPHNTDLAPLVELIDVWRSMSSVEFDDLYINDHAAIAASTIASNPERYSRPALIVRARNKLSTATAGLAMFAGLSGVALASNGAVPGDWNYTIDRALEDFGIGAGGVEERVEEIRSLNDRGNPTGALRQATQHLVDGDSNAADAIQSAADRISTRALDPETSGKVKSEVATLVEYLAENKGNIDGAEVARRAKSIGGPPEGKTDQGKGQSSKGPKK